MNRMRRAAVAVLLGVAAALMPGTVRAQPSQDQAAQTITIRLSNFAFTPKQLQLRVGVPVRLHLVNDSGGGHSFSAPAFFAASASQSGPWPRDGTVQVAAGGSVDITLIPRVAGIYKLECTHFLHGVFGMTGTIVVAGP
jgi:plastocyanin